MRCQGKPLQIWLLPSASCKLAAFRSVQWVLQHKYLKKHVVNWVKIRTQNWPEMPLSDFSAHICSLELERQREF